LNQNDGELKNTLTEYSCGSLERIKQLGSEERMIIKENIQDGGSQR